MKEMGTGRTRLGRFAAVTLPATAVSLGFGLAIAQGAVAAQLSSAEPFTVAGSSLDATGLELSLRAATTATSNGDATETQKKSALVSLSDATINDMCLAANQPTGLPAPLDNIGLNISATGEVPLGSKLNMSADAVNAAGATLPQTDIGVAQSQLDEQAALPDGYNAGGFGLESTGAVSLTGLNADAYGLSLGGLDLTNGLSIAPKLGTATCS